MEIDYANSPVWATLGNTSINLTVKFSAFGFEVPFSASPQDSELHGRQIFSRAVAGEFGPIAPYVAPVPVIPTVVTMVQARLALNQLNLLEPVEIAISTLPRAAQIEWEFRATVQRDSGLVQALAAGLQLSEQILDALFTLAATF